MEISAGIRAMEDEVEAMVGKMVGRARERVSRGDDPADAAAAAVSEVVGDRPATDVCITYLVGFMGSMDLCRLFQEDVRPCLEDFVRESLEEGPATG